MAERIAWARLMRLGMVHLGLAPDRFWALTPAELFLLAGFEDGSAQGMTRGALEALAARFPDRPKGETSDG
ncbi:phage tail assembly chaperone [Paroceanicella profunda]|uniref:Phage tail assembly chaperone n=1 Tax=Paroceanicella profunda TaxID=2579971 RepID=A0A5B8FIH6_9RHOB|nr:rcc01693 family protein [Paroceanicella profunda]QDL93078.1 phage tail assembly chaperone [Paroceanicella profunda]